MENLNVVELNKPELLEISGGSRWRRLRELGEAIWVAIEAHDAWESFKDGWNGCAPDAE